MQKVGGDGVYDIEDLRRCGRGRGAERRGKKRKLTEHTRGEETESFPKKRRGVTVYVVYRTHTNHTTRLLPVHCAKMEKTNSDEICLAEVKAALAETQVTATELPLWKILSLKIK